MTPPDGGDGTDGSADHDVVGNDDTTGTEDADRDPDEVDVSVDADTDGTAAAIDAVAERARERPGELDGEDLAIVIEAGDESVVRDVARAFLRSVDGGDEDRVRETAAAVAPLLSLEADERRELATTLLADLAIDHPAAVAEVTPVLREGLDDAYSAVGIQAVRALRNVSEEAPRAVVDAIDALPAFLDGTDERSRVEATVIATNVARVDPDAVARIVPALLALVGDEYTSIAPEDEPTAAPAEVREELLRVHRRDRVQERQRIAARAEAGEAVAHVARHRPDAVVASLETALEILTDCEPDGAVESIAEAVGAVAVERPDVGAAAIEPLAALLSVDGPESVSAAAAWALGMASEDHREAVATAVVPVLPDVLPLLESDDPVVRARTVGLLTYVAEEAPRATAQATAALAALLEDDEETVRWGAATALGYAGTERVIPALRDVADDDESDDVRAAAAAALDRLERTA